MVLPPLRDLYASSSHTIYEVKNGTSLFCSKCKDVVNCNAQIVRAWLSAPCSGYKCLAIDKPMMSAGLEQPVLHPLGVTIGKKHTHSSHLMYSFKGCYYCDNCGQISSGHRLNNLSRECDKSKAAPKTQGAQNLADIREGRLPSKVVNRVITPNPSSSSTTPFPAPLPR